MGDLTLERAEDLLRTAQTILDAGRMAGVAGLSYQAVEAASVHLIRIVNGREPGRHRERSTRASELLRLCEGEMNRLWELRNIDFYGNVSVGGAERSISLEEARDSVVTAMELVTKVRSYLDGL
jgi:HEPN domain-containing protein